eukprot:CFRG8305T1
MCAAPVAPNSVWKSVVEAETRIRSYVRNTPLEYSTWLSSICGEGTSVYLKLESEQVSGAFKARGAFNKVLRRKETQVNADDSGKWAIVTASTGNHALACAHALSATGQKGLVFLPKTTSEAKIKALRYFAAVCELMFEGDDCVQAEIAGKKFAKENDLPWVSPYNDEDVLAGQGVIGHEIFEKLPSIDMCIVPVGGGGLISGIAGYLKAVNPAIEIVGVQPKASKQMVESVKAGKILDLPTLSTLSDGTAGGIEEGSITFDHCSKYVDKWETLSEPEISKAVFDVLDNHHKVIEGAAGCGVATVCKLGQHLKGKTVVVVVCGSNIGPNVLMDVIKQNLYT